MKQRFFEPVFRSRPFGHRWLTAGAIVKIGLLTLLAPALIGAGFAALLFPFIDAEAGAALQTLAGFATVLMLAPLYGILAVPAGLLLGAWAMRFGLAGWGIALGTALALPSAMEALMQVLSPADAAFGAGLVLTPIVVVHAGALWIATRWIAPASLIAPAQ